MPDDDKLAGDLGDLVSQWEELGIEPDAFVTCAACKRIFSFAATTEDYRTGNICGCDEEEGD